MSDIVANISRTRTAVRMRQYFLFTLFQLFILFLCILPQTESRKEKFQYCSLEARHPCGYCRCMDDHRLTPKHYCDCRYLDPARDCLEHLANGNKENGIYRVHQNIDKVIDVYCDQTNDDGGWMVIQRRIDGKEDFYRNWTEYRNGFGDLQHEFWAGNENIHTMIAHTLDLFGTSLMVKLIDWDEKERFAEYDPFNVESEERKYAMAVGTYDGDAGDDGDGLSYHSGQPFSTYDVNNNPHLPIHCARDRKGGWWYNHCATVNLNGRYFVHNKRVVRTQGIVWAPFNWHDTSLKFTEMKIRRNY